VPTRSIIETRRDQMFPILEPFEIERIRRFGEIRSYGKGEALAKVGQVGPGLSIVLAGNVEVTQHDQSGRRVPIVNYGFGAFMGDPGADLGPPPREPRSRSPSPLLPPKRSGPTPRLVRNVRLSLCWGGSMRRSATS
jgi:CRP-like cAMP-binding protein